VNQVAYFAALLARSDEGWDASDVDLDDVADIDSLADVLRSSADDDEPVLLFLEQEDMWFAVVRVDGEEDPRVFVSDAAAVARSVYGDVLLNRLTEDLDELAGLGLGEDYEGEVSEDYEGEDGPKSRLDNRPLGDADLLTDLGVSASMLYELCAGDGMLPTDALAEIAHRAGFADALESMR
jgi:putative tRNA adenosine deaminase-associated protein